MLSPAQRTLRARMAAHKMHAQGKTNTAAATAANFAKFMREVDPDNVLSPVERARRAEHARKAYMTGLALKSSRGRSRTRVSAPEVETGALVTGGTRDAAPSR